MASSSKQKDELIGALKKRFEANMQRHQGILWPKIESELTDAKIKSLHEMENTGGEPDVIVLDDELFFVDCSSETPKGRINTCYDKEAQRSRKDVQPKGGNAIELAKKMGIELLSEDEYLQLQELGEYDLKTSSWLLTPKEIRELGGAIFADRRYGRVFIYHNGAQSFYSARGFRGKLRI